MPAALIANKSLCSGHGCFPPRLCVQGSSDITINNYPAHRVNDNWDYHTCTTTHNGFLSSGSQKTQWNGRAAGRVGDPVNCGSTAATGSSNTNID